MTDADTPRAYYSLDNLKQLMARLRHPEKGCPWDIQQTFRSIVPSTLEEAYEVAAAIESDDLDHLQEELGDLLFQIIFYSQLASEQQIFDFDAVVDRLTAKLLRRHPHVFPDGTLQSEVDTRSERPESVKLAWEKIKQQEREQRGETGLLDDVPLGLPALTRASKLQKRAANVGFDWTDAAAVLEKVDEELAELRQAISAADHAAQTEELGDLLFSVVNLSRHLKVDAESALRSANAKFASRFGYVEQKFCEEERELAPRQRDLMEAYWQESKKINKGG